MLEDGIFNIIDQIPGYFICKNKDSIYLRANSAATELLGFDDSEQLIGISDVELRCRAAEFAEGFREQDKYVVETKAKLRILDVHPYANDEWKIMLCTKQPIYDSEQNVIGVAGHSIEVASPMILQLSMALLKNKSVKSHKKFQHSFIIDKYKQDFNLTAREKECLFYLIRGKTAKRIANHLNLSPRTVESYLENIKNKMGCDSQSEVIERALASHFNNLLPPSLFHTHLSILLED